MKSFNKLAVHALSDLKHNAIADNALQLVFKNIT